MILDFTPPWFQFNGHIQTIYPSLFRKVPVNYSRERLELEDGDFVDLDWSCVGSDTLLIVTHGLEGDSTRHYVTGLIAAFNAYGIDGLGWNCRSCSGEMNRLPRFYHHGDAGDLKAVVRHAIAMGYKKLVLAGFSMGGSLTLRAVAEWSTLVPAEIHAVMAASVPLDLENSVAELCKKGRRFYMRRFLQKLHEKLKIKGQMFPEDKRFSVEGYAKEVQDFYDFDTRYTAPLHGYKDAIDFYSKASVKPILGEVKVPAFILQAENDPFLGDKCYQLGTSNAKLELKITKSGGHVGFQQSGSVASIAETLFLDFSKKILGLK